MSMTQQIYLEITNMMRDVKDSISHYKESSEEDRLTKLELNFYRLADAIIKVVESC